MEQQKAAVVVKAAEKKGLWVPPPPPPPPLPVPRTASIARRQPKATKSVTREEIDRFWKRKRMEEEEHLLAALKAAARIRARALTEEDYKRFEGSLMDSIGSSSDEGKKSDGEEDGCGDSNKKEVPWVGIKDWWTKSKYAYLNQPAIKSMEGLTAKRPTSAYIPQKISFISSSPTPVQSATTFSLGVF